MSFGVEIREATGVVTFSTESLETHYLGSFIAYGRSGSYTPPEGSYVNYIWAFSGSVHGIYGQTTESMGVWVSGKTIYWQRYFSGIDLPIYYGGYSR